MNSLSRKLLLPGLLAALLLILILNGNKFIGIEWHNLIGILGAALYVISYALLQLHQIDNNAYTYSLMNLIAAAMVLVSLFHAFNLASALIQMVWIVVSVAGISMRYRERRRSCASKPAAWRKKRMKWPYYERRPTKSRINNVTSFSKKN